MRVVLRTTALAALTSALAAEARSRMVNIDIRDLESRLDFKDRLLRKPSRPQKLKKRKNKRKK